MNMIKRAANSLIHWSVRSLPFGVRQRFFDALCSDTEGAIEIVARLAPRIGITEFGVNGEYGLVRGGSRDKIILPNYARSGVWSSRINELLVDFFAGRPGTYFDAGANIGLTTIPVARNPLVKCVAFEPEPGNFAHLSDNVRRNCPHDNVELHQVALAEHHEAVRLGIANGNIGDNRIGFDERGQRRMVKVQGVPLDDFYDRIDGAFAIKIDVQGAEPLVIAGGARTLERADLLIMEFWPHGMREVGSNPAIAIDSVGQFSQVALIHDDGGGEPCYVEPTKACAALRRFVREVRGRESIDVVGRRADREVRSKTASTAA
jgi:FkbM family methyltransferase